MNNPLISAFLAGCLITTGLLSSYLIHRKRFELKFWLNTAPLAIGIGAIFTMLLCEKSPIFSTFVAIAVAAIIYFSPLAKQNEKLEQLLVSIAGGVLIGMVSMVGFFMCC